MLDFSYLHDIPHDDTVDELWCDGPCSEGSFGGMLGQICGTVIPQDASIGTERSALGGYNKYPCREKEFSAVTAAPTIKPQPEYIVRIY